MDITKLSELGGLVPTQPVKKEISWTSDEGQEHTFDIFVKKLSYGDYEKLFHDPLSNSIAKVLREQSKKLSEEEDKGLSAIQDLFKDQRSRQAMMIHLSIRLGEEANEQLTYEQAYQLHPTLASTFVKAVNEVNGAPKKS